MQSYIGSKQHRLHTSAWRGGTQAEVFRDPWGWGVFYGPMAYGWMDGWYMWLVDTLLVGNPGKLERDDGDKDLWRVALLAPARYGSCKIPETLTCVEINLLARNSRCHILKHAES